MQKNESLIQSIPEDCSVNRYSLGIFSIFKYRIYGDTAFAQNGILLNGKF